MNVTLHGAPARFEGGLREVGRGVFVWLQPDGGWGEVNAGLVVGEGASTLIDTLWDQPRAREMLSAMAPHTVVAPIELVINTHSDGDHWWGNAEVPDDAAILTSAASLETMHEEAPPAGLARLRKLAGTVRHAPGAAGAMGRYVSDMLAPFDFDGVRLRHPDRTFKGERTEQVGGRELRLTEVGPAHTAGDLVIHVPDAGVVFGADILFFGVTPAMWAGPLANWLRALDLLLSLDADVYVPGHGDVGGRAEVEALRDYWRWLDAGVRTHHAAGRSAMETARTLIREPQFARYRDWICPERIVMSVTAVHRELSGKGPIPSSPPARARLFAQIAAIKREIER
ncbi:MBL fold metallo-hydrolase [Conexibacter stalactiti]|uniref:MBL fold metallo-hydrolase n=1 Tax=Conexibacter stalactiti TaxID=1940611 RepID=A0ABU4HN51_9ACTN|nr:MBL fold metallo-hydrolase [Conexibacter stalactiti]MDW5594736.1 MBL fold metallo-hydrolase [Conexibacter stalactiti]MEC5035378.1 MBL fold metallo-hydrolase [Conexibacter stalactiti]